MAILGPPRPRGAAIRRYAVGGARSAPAGGVTIHSREASGHRPGGTTAPVRGARWTGWRKRPCPTPRCGAPFGALRPQDGMAGPPALISAARRLKNAGKRSATGRADGGSIHPRRILAQWKRPDTTCASRRSAAPHPGRTRQRGRPKAYVREPPGARLQRKRPASPPAFEISAVGAAQRATTTRVPTLARS